MAMIIIGITGPTGAGKTTALHQLHSLGGYILDADLVYHQLLEENLPMLGAIEETFGPMRGEDGRFQRKKLGAIVFQNPEALEQLSVLVRPYILTALERELTWARAQGYRSTAIDAIGLFESGLDGLCHTTVSITAPPETRIARIMAREGISRDYASARVSAQKADDFYTQRSHDTLVNDDPSPEEFSRRAKRFFQNILAQDKLSNI